MAARCCLVLALLFGLCALAPRDALADSDGYYCTTDRYIAYEFSFSKRLSSAHVLTVIFFDDAEGRIEAIDVTLAVFQVHGMKCGADAVEILSFKELYEIDLTDRGNLAAAKIREFGGNISTDPGVNVDDYRNLGNLGAWNSATANAPLAEPELTVIPLSSTNKTFKYFLHITAYSESHRYDGGSIHFTYIHSKIVKKNGPVVYDIFDIYSGYGEMTVD